MARFKFNTRPVRDRKNHYDDIPGNERPNFSVNSGGSIRSFADSMGGNNSPANSQTANEVSPHEYAQLSVVSHAESPRVTASSSPNAASTDSGYPSIGTRGVAETDGTQQTAVTETTSDNDYDFDKSLSEFYTQLYNKLRSYGITSIPTFDSLYGLFASFLRPAIDSAIAARNARGRQNMAELDADAYARGMGGSSYISSMKAREQDDVNSDIISLEGQYSASMSEYLYKALSSMQQIESEMERTRMTIAAQQAAALARASASGGGSGRSGRSGGSSGKSSSGKSGSSSKYGHNSKGAYFDGVWYSGNFSYLKSNASYNDYANYLNGLSASERYLFFTSNQRTWRMRRWQVQYNMPEIDYNDLYAAYMTTGGSSGGGGGSYVHYGPGGNNPRWTATPY